MIANPMKIRWVFIKNAAASLARAGTAGIVALLLPPLLVRHMSATDYGIWVLVLQCGSYVAYLDFGLQTAVGRYFAYATEKKDFRQRVAIFSTAIVALALVAFVSTLLLLAVIASLHLIFPSIPINKIPVMQWSLLILGISLALGLPASAWSGIFVGLQRYDIPAFTIGGARLLSALGVTIAVLLGHSIFTLAVVTAIVNCCSYGVLYLAKRQIAPDVGFEPELVQRETTKELASYCLGLTVMSFSMLLVTGLDVTLVARYQFNAVIPYSVCANLVVFLSGGVTAALNVMMPHAAALHARQDARALGRLVKTCTRGTVVFLIFSGLSLIIYAIPILTLWIGPQFAQVGRPILITLVIANMIRVIGVPYAIVIIAAGQQRLTMVSPLTEGICNFICSLILGSMFGAIGVALGTLIGGCVGIAAQLFYSMPRTSPVIFCPRVEYLGFGVIAPSLAAAPLFTLAALSIAGNAPFASNIKIVAPAIALSALMSLLLVKHVRVVSTESKLAV
jgi:O-antigen/teichoic acid export membrane protein